MRVRRAPVALVALVLSACGGGSSPPSPTLTWQQRTLPVSAGERAVVQSAAWCGGRWYVAGATADTRGDTRPAVWSSDDGRTWRHVRLHPGADYYAERAILTSVACSHGHIAALGAKPGGAHGNPRVETWRQQSDGSLAAVQAPFEQYGGQDAVSVNRLSGGAGGFLVTGTRVSGAAVWSSSDGNRFTIHERAPGLADTSAATTQALDAVWWGRSWTVVGDATRSTGLVATVWTGTVGGPWTPTSLPRGAGLTTAERVVGTGGGPVVAGLDGHAVGIWGESGGRWAHWATFGATVPGATSPAYVAGLAWTGSRLAVVYSDGARFRLELGVRTSWTGAPLPAAVGVRGDHTVTVAAHGKSLLLLTDDGRQGRVWLASS
jgi:hypothetical protein